MGFATNIKFVDAPLFTLKVLKGHILNFVLFYIYKGI